MRVITTDTMRELDRTTIEDRGIPGIDLMNKAGAGVARATIEFLEGNKDKNIGILTGPGNNGGDGWVAARILHAQGYPVKVFSAINPDKLTGDALTAFKDAKSSGIQYIIDVKGAISIDDIDLIIDALLGTGAKGEPRGAIGEMVKRVISSKIPVIAVDNPTGVDSDTGEIYGIAINAEITTTFGLPKLGQFVYPGKKNVGRLMTVDIGIPENVILASEHKYEIDSTSTLANLLSVRPENGHKGTFGKCAIIAGSEGMCGAAVLAAESALRSGTGLVELVVPKSLVETVESLFREVVTRPVQEIKNKRCFSVRSMGDILRVIQDVDSIALGPGIGTHYETVELVSRLVNKIDIPMIIDADGLNCLAKAISKGNKIEFSAPVVMTPHPGELSRLINIGVDDILSNRFDGMHDWLSQLGIDTLLLKGASTTICSSDSPVFINRTGNDGMATGGSGDVLTGIIAGLIAQGVTPSNSTRLGAYIHGFAGDIAAAELGKRSMIAGDIIKYIPDAISYLEFARD